jgi:hypothetical protein
MACGQFCLRAQLFLVIGDATNADQVALAWTPSPDPNAVGYFLAWGLATGQCTNRLDAGPSTSMVVAGLEPTNTYYFEVVTYDGLGDESVPSNELAYTPPGPPPATNAPPLNIAMQPAGVAAPLCVTFQADRARTFDLQASQDLQHWQTVQSTNCNTAAPVVFGVTDVTNYPQRFYRLARH